MEGGTVPIPSIEELDFLASALCPGVSVGQRRVQSKRHNAKTEENDGAGPSNRRILPKTEAADPVRGKVVDLTEGHDGEIQGWKVVVEE